MSVLLLQLEEPSGLGPHSPIPRLRGRLTNDYRGYFVPLREVRISVPANGRA
jgi:hypothetical protein